MSLIPLGYCDLLTSLEKLDEYIHVVFDGNRGESRDAQYCSIGIHPDLW